MKSLKNTKKYTLRLNLDLKVFIKINAENIKKAEDILYQMSIDELLKGELIDWEAGEYIDFTKLHERLLP